MGYFFATIAGAIISLLGVYLTLRRNQKIHEENLKEERRKNKEAREFTAKQGSLLAAADAVTRFLTYYMTIADRVLPQDGSVAEEITELGVALNRLHFYCSLETIEKSTQLGQVLNEVIAEAMMAKIPSAFIMEELKIIDLEISGLERTNAILQEEIRALLFSDPKNSLILLHREQLAENFQSISDLQKRKAELFKNKYIETEKCRDVISRNLRIIYESSRDVLLLARKELNFPIEEENYSRIINERLNAMEVNLEKSYAVIRQQAEEIMQRTQ